jgi:hypothetical protein
MEQFWNGSAAGLDRRLNRHCRQLRPTPGDELSFADKQ